MSSDMVMILVREEELDVRVEGIYPKFEIQIPGNEGRVSDWWTKFIYRFFIKGIKSIRFQKLVFLLYLLSYPASDAGLSDMLKNRVAEIEKNNNEYYRSDIKSWNYQEENLEVLKVEEIMDILNCSRESAKDYKNTLKAILRFF